MAYEPKENEVLTKSVKLNNKDDGSVYFSVNIGDIDRLIALVDKFANKRGVRLSFNTVQRPGNRFFSTQMYVDEIPEPQNPQGQGRGGYGRSAESELSRVGRTVA